MSRQITGIVAWLKNWFYDIGQINTFLNAKANKNQGTANYNVVTDASGDIAVEPKINVASNSGLSLNASTKALSHSNTLTGEVLNDAGTGAAARKFSYDANGHLTYVSYMYATDIYMSSTDPTKVETAISNLQNFKFIEIGTSKPATASADTMGKLYIVSETVNNVAQVNVYYTKATTTGSTTTYSWEELDTNILDSLTVNWSDVQGKPSSFTPASHTHGGINNNGELTTSELSFNSNDMPLIVDVSDNNKIRKGSIGSGKVKNAASSNWTNIKSDIGANETQAYVNNYINTKFGTVDTAIGNRVTSIDLVPYADDNTGAIILYYGDEPSSS